MTAQQISGRVGAVSQAADEIEDLRHRAAFLDLLDDGRADNGAVGDACNGASGLRSTDAKSNNNRKICACLDARHLGRDVARLGRGCAGRTISAAKR